MFFFNLVPHLGLKRVKFWGKVTLYAILHAVHHFNYEFFKKLTPKSVNLYFFIKIIVCLKLAKKVKCWGNVAKTCQFN